MTHEHIWIEGPEVPLMHGTYLSRLCTECGISQVYDWYGNVRWQQYELIPTIEEVLEKLEYY